MIALFLTGCAEMDLYPLFRAGPIDDEGSWEWEAIGPLIYGRDIRATADERADRPRPAVRSYAWNRERDEWGVRPLFSVADFRDTTATTEVLWPFGRFHRGKRGWAHRMIPIYWDWGWDDEAIVRRSTFVFPVFLHRSGPPGDALMIFPFYGEAEKFLGMDRLSFVMFPLYVGTGRGETDSHHVVWPLFGGGAGPDESWLRIFPFFSYGHRDGKYDYAGYAWPFVNVWRDMLDTDRPRDGYMIFPFYGRWTRPGDGPGDGASGWNAMFPLFRAEHDERRETHDANLPWPLYSSWSTKYSEGWRLWPFYAAFDLYPNERGDYLRSRTYLWPIVWDRSFDTGRSAHEQFLVRPFVNHHRWVRRDGAEGGAWGVWPLVERTRYDDGSGKFAIVAPFFHRILNDPWHERLGVLTSPYVEFEAGERVRAFSWLGLHRRYAAPGFERWTIPLLYSRRTGRAGTLEQFLLGSVRVERRTDGSSSWRLFGIEIAGGGAR